MDVFNLPKRAVSTVLRVGLGGCALLLGACGGGGGDTSSGVAPDASGTTEPPPAATTDLLTVGAITGFGSVFVNGIKFETDTAAITVEGASASEADLSIGQIVMVLGTVNDDRISGQASQIIFDDDVEGPISAIDPAAGVLIVLGQTIVVDAGTTFDERIASGLSSLTVGDVVEVSGFVRSDGAIAASRIELKPAGQLFEVNGVVTALDLATSTFMIGDLVVNYSQAALSDFDSGSLSNGDLVEVKGMTFDSAGALLAQTVERKSPLSDMGDNDQRNEVEIEGLITRFTSAQDFDVAGIPVLTNDATRFENGTAADLGLNVKVEAEGQLQSDGSLIARKVSIRRGGSARLAATVQDVDAPNNRLTVLGIAVQLDALTRIEDDSDADNPRFSISDLRSGDWVEVRGTELPAGSNEVLASRLAREDPDDEVEVQGQVDSFAANETLSILGVTIAVDARTQYEAIDGTALTAEAFFAAVGEGVLVKAQGQDIGANVVLAEELEFEVED